MCPYKVMFGREPRWEHRVPSHLRHMATVEHRSISNSDSDSDEGAHDAFADDSSSNKSQGSGLTAADLLESTDSDDGEDGEM